MVESEKKSEVRRIKPDLMKKIAGKDDGMSSLHLARQSNFPKGVVWGAVGLVLVFLVSFGYLFYVAAKDHFGSAVTRNIGQLQAGVEDLKSLDPRSAEQKFSAANDDLNLTFGGIIEKLGPFFKNTSNLVGGFQKLTGLGTRLTQEAVFFKENLLPDFVGGKGPDIIAHLENLTGVLKDIQSTGDVLALNASNLESFGSQGTSSFGAAYLPLRLGVANAERFLENLTAWLKFDGTRHILLMLQNPSEMRPGGGFLGSYADVAIEHAGLSNIGVHDIADVDLAFKPNVIPPKPLQAEVTRFRPADANWFFDFSQSAAEVIRYMESSTIYSASSTQFDAAIAVSPGMIRDLLAVTGPIDLAASKVTLDQDNFLEVLQAKVQAGQAQGSTYPKSILRELSSALIAKLSSADDAAKQKLLLLAQNWLNKKEVMAYFKDPAIESLLSDYGVSGKMYVPSSNFEGDYLALADANINGAKSDLFVNQTATLQSQINASGSVTNHLVIDRAHIGNTRSEWWYNAPNQDYLQVFTAPPSALINFSGGSAVTVSAPLNYAKSGYSTDPLVAAIESSTAKVFNYPAVSQHDENGMHVFSAWSKIKPGENTELVFDYSHRLFSEIGDGTQYTFVFEKQAGSKRNYMFDLSAPAGFRFKENNLPVYEYQSDDPPGRLVLVLTLEKI